MIQLKCDSDRGILTMESLNKLNKWMVDICGIRIRIRNWQFLFRNSFGECVCECECECEWIRGWRNWRVGDFPMCECDVMCETFNFIRKTVYCTRHIREPSSFHQLAIHHQNWKLILFISRCANKIPWFNSLPFGALLSGCICLGLCPFHARSQMQRKNHFYWI